MLDDILRERWYQTSDGTWMQLWLTDQDAWDVDVEAYGPQTALENWFRRRFEPDVLVMQEWEMRGQG